MKIIRNQMRNPTMQPPKETVIPESSNEDVHCKDCRFSIKFPKGLSLECCPKGKFTGAKVKSQKKNVLNAEGKCSYYIKKRLRFWI